MFSPLSVCLCLSVYLCTGYLKKLWMDSDETWLTGWVCDKDELIRFFEHPDPNPDPDPDTIIYIMILHY